MPIDPSKNPLSLPDFQPAAAGWDAIVQEVVEKVAPQDAIYDDNDEAVRAHDGVVEFSTPAQLPSYTVAGLPSASPASQFVYVSNETGGAVTAFSDGTNWRRTTDRAIVSA